MHEMLEHDASAIKVVARRQACFENQHGCRALGKSDPIEGSPDVPMRAQRVDADVGIPGMDENLFVLLIPGIERAPAETSRAGHPGNRVLAGYPDGTMTLHAARAQAMPMRRPLPRALVVLIVGEEAHADVAGRDVALRGLHPFPYIARLGRVEDLVAAKSRTYPPRRRLGATRV